MRRRSFCRSIRRQSGATSFDAKCEVQSWQLTRDASSEEGADYASLNPSRAKSHRPSSVLAAPLQDARTGMSPTSLQFQQFQKPSHSTPFLVGVVRHQQTLPTETANEYLKRLLNLYGAMFTAREIDRVESELVRQGLAFFHVSGAGHEATATLARHLGPDDWLHLHYRDKALAIARGVPIDEFFRSLLARRDSHSAGRQISAHFSAPTAKILSLVIPVGNNALQAVGVAAAIAERPGASIAVCGLGDGGTQEGEFLEAVAEAVRSRLPLLFLVQDNRYSISTPTRRRTFFDRPDGPAREFYGLELHRVDGTDCEAADVAFSELVSAIRRDRMPRIAILNVERLCSHTNADEQSRYRDPEEIADCARSADPISGLDRRLIELGIDRSELESLKNSIRAQVRQAADTAPEGLDPDVVFDAKSRIPADALTRTEYRGDGSAPD